MTTLFARRLTAALVAVVLPFAAVAGCGAQKKASIREELTAAGQSLQSAKAASVTVHVQDVKGALRGLLTKGSDAPSPQQTDALLQGSVAVTVDAAGSKTLRDLRTSGSTTPTGEQLKSLNLAIVVSGSDGALAQLRLVEGVLYANVNLTKIKALVPSSGGKDFDTQLDLAAEGAPPGFAQLLKDVRAGKWVKLSLVDHLKEIQDLTHTLPSPSASPSPVDTKALTSKLYAAIKPYVTVTDANNSSTARVLDVKLSLKPALKAALASLKGTPGFGALDGLDTAQLDSLKDGTINGTLTLTKSHLTKITLDLASVQSVVASDTSGKVIAGGLLVIDIDDSAAELTAPSDVSSTDLDALVSDLFSGLSENLTGGGPTQLG